MTEELIVKIPAAGEFIQGSLIIPKGAQGVVLFAHGSGSSRFSPRNQFVAKTLRDGGLATLLFDLLTPSEDAIDNETREFRFDIGRLATRLIEVIDWLKKNPTTKMLSIGCFGSSTGAAAALIAAAKAKQNVQAVVSRGGRTDLAGSSLPLVTAPTLFIVGGDDFGVIELNEAAYSELQCKKKLEIVPGATHLFEEPGKLEKVAELACDWFKKYLEKT